MKIEETLINNLLFTEKYLNVKNDKEEYALRLYEIENDIHLSKNISRKAINCLLKIKLSAKPGISFCKFKQLKANLVNSKNEMRDRLSKIPNLKFAKEDNRETKIEPIDKEFAGFLKKNKAYLRLARKTSSTKFIVGDVVEVISRSSVLNPYKIAVISNVDSYLINKDQQYHIIDGLGDSSAWYSEDDFLLIKKTDRDLTFLKMFLLIGRDRP